MSVPGLAAEIRQRCFDDGLVIETSGPCDEVVKVFAALTTPANILERGLDIRRTPWRLAHSRC
jgi:diaminobutyrate-2-oxoglutarate transaminase